MEREILPCPSFSLHTHFEETCGALFGDAHGTEMLLSTAHAIQGLRNNLQNEQMKFCLYNIRVITSLDFIISLFTCPTLFYVKP